MLRYTTVSFRYMSLHCPTWHTCTHECTHTYLQIHIYTNRFTNIHIHTKIIHSFYMHIQYIENIGWNHKRIDENHRPIEKNHGQINENHGQVDKKHGRIDQSHREFDKFAWCKPWKNRWKPWENQWKPSTNDEHHGKKQWNPCKNRTKQTNRSGKLSLVGEVGWVHLQTRNIFLIPITCFDSQGFFDHNSFIDPLAHKLGFEESFFSKCGHLQCQTVNWGTLVSLFG